MAEILRFLPQIVIFRAFTYIFTVILLKFYDIDAIKE